MRANPSFGRRTPWGDEDPPALVTEVETALERQLRESIMRGGARPDILRVKQNRELLEQESSSDEWYLLLNGVLVVEVDGESLVAIPATDHRREHSARWLLGRTGSRLSLPPRSFGARVARSFAA